MRSAAAIVSPADTVWNQTGPVGTSGHMAETLGNPLAVFGLAPSPPARTRVDPGKRADEQRLIEMFQHSQATPTIRRQASRQRAHPAQVPPPALCGAFTGKALGSPTHPAMVASTSTSVIVGGGIAGLWLHNLLTIREDITSCCSNVTVSVASRRSPARG